MNPIVLLSVINTKLRDQYDSLLALCEDLDYDYEEICNTLKSIGYTYCEKENQFKQTI